LPSLVSAAQSGAVSRSTTAIGPSFPRATEIGSSPPAGRQWAGTTSGATRSSRPTTTETKPLSSRGRRPRRPARSPSRPHPRPLGAGSVAWWCRAGLGRDALRAPDGARAGVPAPPRGERALGVAVARGHQVLVLARVGVKDGERAEAAPLLGRLDHRDRDAVEALV